MSTSLPYVVVGFSLAGVSVYAPATLRLRFTADPLRASSVAANDATNPTNYSLSGPRPVLITGIAAVGDDPQAVDLFLNVPLNEGTWVIFASAAIEALGGDTLVAPTTLTFSLAAPSLAGDIGGGAENDSAAQVLRQHLPPSMGGSNWDSLLQAIAIGDTTNNDNARLAFDQLFISSASDNYLERRAADVGIIKNTNIGISDEAFRSLVIAASTDKLTSHAVLKVLEVFFGTDAVKAFSGSTVEPFALQAGQTLDVEIDGQESVVVTFQDQDFHRTGEAKAIEVAAALNRCFEQHLSNAFALPYFDPLLNGNVVRIYSGTLGLESSVAILGGLSQSALLFNTLLGIELPSSTAVSVTVPNVGVARYTITNADTLFISLRDGDYVNVSGSNFVAQNQGSFPISNILLNWNGTAWVQSFDVKNQGLAQSASTTTTTDLLFFRPTVNTIQESRRTAVVSQADGDLLEISVPATSQIVGRGVGTGAYLHDNAALTGTVVVGTDGVGTFSGSVTHGLSAGDTVQIVDMAPSETFPATVAGTPGAPGATGTSDASQMSIWSAMRSPDGYVATSEPLLATLTTGETLIVAGLQSGISTTMTSRLAFTSHSTPTSGPAKGRDIKSYNYLATAPLPSSATGARLTALSGSFAGKALIVGGLGVPTPSLSPRAYWRMETAGATVVDSVPGNAYPLVRITGTGGVSASGGIIANGITLDGSTGYRVINMFSGAPNGINATIVVWFKVSAVPSSAMAIWGAGALGAFNSGHALYLKPDGSGNLTASSGPGTGPSPGVGTLALNTQHFALIQIEGQFCRISVDNQPIYIESSGGLSPSDNLYVGCQADPAGNPGFFCDSTVTFDELAVFDGIIGSSVDQAPIAEIYNRGLNGISLLGGGSAGTGAALTYTSNAWTAVPNNALDSRQYHTQTRLDGASDNVVLIVGGLSAPTTAVGTIQTWTPAGGGTIATVLTESVPRFAHSVVALTASKALVAGGARFVSTTPVVRADCWEFDALTSTKTNVGSLATARREFALATLTDGAVLAIGGLGHVLSSETADRTLKECEIYRNGSWQPAAPLNFARSGHSAAVFGGKCYVYSGIDETGQIVPYTEVYDHVKGQWQIIPSNLTAKLVGSAVTSEGVYVFGGKDNTDTELSQAKLLVPGANQLGLVPDEVTVTATTSNSFTFVGDGVVTAEVTAVANKSVAGGHPGPYIWDIDQGAALTGQALVLVTPISAGKSYTSIQYTLPTGAKNLPDEVGYLAFSYGFENEVYPVKYLGRTALDTVALDFSYVFDKSIPAGASISLLAQKGPYDPISPQKVGSFYLTDSPSGRVEAQKVIDEMLAGGIDYTVKVEYPGDKGLGGAGYPETGNKISDKVWIWGNEND